MVETNMEEEYFPKFVEILIEDVDGQSCGKTVYFKGFYAMDSSRIISSHIAEFFKRKADERTGYCVYVECDINSQTKLDIMLEISKQNNGYNIVTEELCPGSNWGSNVYVRYCDKKDEQKALTNLKNKTNKKISKLKKASTPKQ